MVLFVYFLYVATASLLTEKSTRRMYRSPIHTVPLHSVLDYPDAKDTLYDSANKIFQPSVENATGPIFRSSLRGNGVVPHYEGNAFVQTSGPRTPDGQSTAFVQTHSIVHASQLARLRMHQKEVAERVAREAALKRQAEEAEREAEIQREGEEAAASEGARSERARRSWIVDVNGVIPLTNLRDSQYVGPIGVGTKPDGNPESMINVVFDTGSTNLWIASTLCSSSECKSRNQYDAHKSNTYARPNIPVHLDITFGTGELRGPQGIDYFHVGPYVVKNQTFGMIEDEIGEVFEEIPFEGILGLAFPSMSARHVTPFFDNVMQQNVLFGHNEISFYMTKMPDTTSAVFFGGVDDRFFQGDILYFPVTQEHYWSIDIIDFKVGDVSHVNFLEYKSSGPRVSKLILDTGTTYFTAPPGLFAKITDRLPSTNCAEVHKYPSLHYILRDVDNVVHDITVPPEVYMVSTYGDGWCDLSFMEIPVPDQYGPAFIFGEVFMREWYTVYNRGTGSEGTATVGFAKAHAPGRGVTDAIKQRNSATRWMRKQ